MSELRPGMPAGIWREAPERFERNNMDNLSVICFANATVSLRLGHGAGLTAHLNTAPPLRYLAQGRQAAAAGISFPVAVHTATAPSWQRGPVRAAGA